MVCGDSNNQSMGVTVAYLSDSLNDTYVLYSDYVLSYFQGFELELCFCIYNSNGSL